MKSIIHVKPDEDDIQKAVVFQEGALKNSREFIASVLNKLVAVLMRYSSNNRDNQKIWLECEKSKGDFNKHKFNENGRILDLLKTIKMDDDNQALKKNLDACMTIYDHMTSSQGRELYTKAYKMNLKYGKDNILLNWYNYRTMCVVLYMAITEMILKAIDSDYYDGKRVVVHRVDAVKAKELEHSTWNEMALNLAKYIKKNNRDIYAGRLDDLGKHMRTEGVSAVIGLGIGIIVSVSALITFAVWMARNVVYMVFKLRHDLAKLTETQRKYLEMHVLNNRNMGSREKQQKYVEYMKRMEKIFAIEEEDMSREVDKKIEDEDREIYDQANNEYKNQGNTALLA